MGNLGILVHIKKFVAFVVLMCVACTFFSILSIKFIIFITEHYVIYVN